MENQAIVNGTQRECCKSGAHLVTIEDTPTTLVRRCHAPHPEGSIEVDGVRVCGRRQFTGRFKGLDARAVGANLGG